MRVIAGRFRSRKLKSVPGIQVRPTPDRLRESLFSILMPRLPGITFLDAYAGSGAVAIEALSRGAQHIILIERSAEAVTAIRENLQSLGIENEATMVRGKANGVLPGLLQSRNPEIVFLDPPYEQTAEYTQSLTALGNARTPCVVAQHPSKMLLAEQFGELTKFRVLRQGDNSLSFYRLNASADE